jgi:hypothetical protein
VICVFSSCSIQEKETTLLSQKHWKQEYPAMQHHDTSVLVSYAFVDVHFLHFGELKMQFLPFAPFRYWKYILNNFGCMLVNNSVAIRNINKACILAG